jgi:hypothetical protein
MGHNSQLAQIFRQLAYGCNTPKEKSSVRAAESMLAATFTSRLGAARPATRAPGVRPARRSVVPPVRAAAETKEAVDELGFKLMRKGVKEAAKDSLLTPRWVRRGPGTASSQGLWRRRGPRIVCGRPPPLPAGPRLAPPPPLPPPAPPSSLALIPTPPTLQLLHHQL